MKTAVEWLENKFYRVALSELPSLFEKAQQLEKQQIIDACNQTEFEDIDGIGIHETITKGEQYYNETFNDNPDCKDKCYK